MLHIIERVLVGVLLVGLTVGGSIVGYERVAQAEIVELTRRVHQLGQVQKKRQIQLDQMQSELQVLRREVQEAQEVAARSRCEAMVAQIDAEVTVTRVQCLKAQSEYAECNARNEAKTAKGGFWGCALGLGAAVLTGGAAAPLTMAGCAGGAMAGASSEKACGAPPVCTAQFNEIAAMVLASRGLSQWPVCSAPDQAMLR